MVKDLGAGVNRDSEVTLVASEGGKALETVVLASFSICKSLLVP